MRVRLPNCKWARHVTGIRGSGVASGWSLDGEFLRLGPRNDQPTTASPGSLIVCYDETAQAARHNVSLYVVLDGPLLYRAASIPVQESWASALGPYIQPLLRLTEFERCAYATMQLQRAYASQIRDSSNRTTAAAAGLGLGAEPVVGQTHQALPASEMFLSRLAALVEMYLGAATAQQEATRRAVAERYAVSTLLLAITQVSSATGMDYGDIHGFLAEYLRALAEPIPLTEVASVALPDADTPTRTVRAAFDQFLATVQPAAAAPAAAPQDAAPAPVRPPRRLRLRPPSQDEGSASDRAR